MQLWMTILVTSTTCTTRTCIEYDYMHMYVRTLHCATNYTECSIRSETDKTRSNINRWIKLKLCTQSYISHNFLQHECH